MILGILGLPSISEALSSGGSSLPYMLTPKTSDEYKSVKKSIEILQRHFYQSAGLQKSKGAEQYSYDLNLAIKILSEYESKFIDG